MFLLSLTIQMQAQEHKCFVNKGLDSAHFIPQTINKVSQEYYFITFPKHYFGKLALCIEAAGHGRAIIKMGEKALNDTAVDVKPPGTVRFFVDTVALKKGKNHYLSAIPTFEPPGWAKGKNYDVPLPDSIGNIMPFRYVGIQGLDGKISLCDARQVAYFYPFNDTASACTTSSDALNDVWALCKHSVKATTYAGVYVDGDRERRPYEGDAYINQLSHYVVDAEYAIARQTIRHLFEYPTWPTEWPLHMHLMIWADYMYTGNDAFLKLYYDELKSIVDDTPVNDAGLLINAKGDDIIDWPRSERDGYQIGNINTVPNAFYNNSLQLMVKIAGVLNKTQDALFYADKAARHNEQFNKHFWDAEKGLYIDAVDSTHSSLHANIFPVVFGLASPKQVSAARPFILSKGMAVSVYGAQYLLDALYIIDEPDHALKLMTASNDRSWLNMINRGGTITWEAWNEEVKPNLDWNHAWAAAPANIIARRLFGIRPLMSGFKKVLIEPKTGDLKQGKIVHPTINGQVEMHFTKNNNDTITFDIDLPMPAVLILPLQKYQNKGLSVNSKPYQPVIKGGKMNIQLDATMNRVEVIMQRE
jgi:alpha-L-rhamnosidase